MDILPNGSYKCVTNCEPEYGYLGNYTCNVNCPEPFLKNIDFLCVNPCGSKLYNNTTHCIEVCPDG